MGDLRRFDGREILERITANAAANAGEPVTCRQCQREEHERDVRDGLCPSCSREKHRRSDPAAVLAEAGCPERYRDCTLARWQGPLPGDAPGWLSREPKNRPDLLIWGPTGTGKTHLATALLFDRLCTMTASEFGQWRSARGFLEELKSEFDAVKAGKSLTRSAMDRHLGARIMLLDDMGAELLADGRGAWRADRISYLFCERYDRRLATIVSTNLSPAELIHVDARVWSRMTEGVIIHLDGEDWRDRPVKP